MLYLIGSKILLDGEKPIDHIRTHYLKYVFLYLFFSIRVAAGDGVDLYTTSGLNHKKFSVFFLKLYC